MMKAPRKLADNERYINAAQPWLGTFYVSANGTVIGYNHNAA